ncbi:MAG: MerR family transcriptional regulator [Mogibacterium sp.]|nr:MerR family transcriptional regulator [Mogibacterium sp.]
MKNYYDRTWKIGELARMFDINVQLLRHYDKEGLLVPEIRNPDNNWRTYKYDQIYPLGMIRFLRQLDCSLDDIGAFMPERNADSTEKYLRRRMKAVRARYEKLLQMESVMNDRFALINREMKYAATDQIYVYSEEEIYYIEIGGIEDIFVDELFYLYPTLVFHEEEGTRFAVWIPGDETAKFDRYSDRLRVLPLDEYLVGFHKGPHDEIHSTFERMEQAAEGILEEGCRLDDTKICIDIIDQFIEADKNNYVTKVMIKIIR